MKENLFLKIFIVFAFFFVGCSDISHKNSVQLEVVDMECDHQVNPIGIGNENPNLHWKVKSETRGERTTAYQIVVASKRNLLDSEKSDIWNSGKQKYINNEEILFKGEKLVSSKKYYWKVRVWGNDDVVSDWSEPASWETALLQPEDWLAKWIVDDKPIIIKDEDFYKEHPAPVFRKDFSLGKVENARLYISGLGYYEAYLNGNRVGNHRLDPGWTSYDKRVFYSCYDVTDLLNEGENAIGVMVGNGWYNPLPLRMWGVFNLRTDFDIVGKPTLIAQLRLEYKDGSVDTIYTDDSWKIGESPILKNNIYLGEVYDSRKEIPGWNKAGYDDSKWSNAVIANKQFTNLFAQPLPPIRITKTVNPVALSKPKPGVYLYDMGQNFAGWIKFRAKGKSGAKIKFRYGELIYPDGNLNVMTSVCGQIKKPDLGGPGAPDIAWQCDEFILNGEGEQSFNQHFTYHGFRYVEVSGLEYEPELKDMTGLRLNTDVAPVGTFSCSNEMFNKLYEVINWTFLSNLYSVETDCPAREKFGYGGDIIPVSDSYIHYFDMSATYSKIARDFGDAARENNSLTETAPFIKGMESGGYGDGSGPIGWAMAHPVLLEKMYRYYGNKALIEEQYEYSKNWLEFMINQADGYIISNGIGDHEKIDPPQEQLVNTKGTPVTSTAFFYDAASRISRLAKIIGKDEDAKKYSVLAENIKKSFIDNLMTENGKFGLATQTHQSFALKYDLVPDEYKEMALQALIDTIVIKHNKHLSTGIFATRFMFDILSESGNVELAYSIANQKTFPGWGYMLENSATTLWEHWDFSDNTFSHNHSMFGSISHWFITTLAGIGIAEDAVGYDKIIIKPEIVGDLNWAEASYNSINGIVSSSWNLNKENLSLEVEIPVNSTAVIYIPADSKEEVFENDKAIEEVEGIEILNFKDHRLAISVGSGKYSFVSGSIINNDAI